ncbi:MAG TPA: ABC transporter substrate-binding protein [Pseudolabrys sp.]|jgi:putative ABC transport system substrate-binding protein|nr:ABC transporter substrate-binding protein [Pseudolabrys sp.]
MRRREFITLLGSAATWSFAACAQQSVPVVGFVNSSSAQAQAAQAAAFRRGLEDSGFVEGKNVLIERRWADGQYSRLPELIADLVKRNAAVLMTGGPPAALAAKKATSTIPIVFTSGDDPVQAGLVSSINKPGGNVTGVHIFFTEVEPKKLGLLRELVPNAGLIVALVNPKFSAIKIQTQGLQAAANTLGQRIEIINASSELELDEAFASMKQLQAAAILVGSDPFFASRRDQIVSLAARYAIPAVYEQRSFATAGGLMSYGTNLAEAYRQAGVYTGRILKGEKPSELPVLLADKFEFVINLKVAKTLGLTVSPNLLSTADDVIE